jgi:hypothetical protein
LHASPKSVSLPPSPFSVSLPSSPQIVSAAALPVSVSLPAVGPTTGATTPSQFSSTALPTTSTAPGLIAGSPSLQSWLAGKPSRSPSGSAGGGSARQPVRGSRGLSVSAASGHWSAPSTTVSPSSSPSQASP